MALEKTIKIKGDASSAVAALKEVGAAADKTQAKAEDSSKAINDGMSALDKRTGGAVSAFKGLTGGIKSAIGGFNTLKGAIIATGLGALLIAITSLIAYFKETERGADQLKVITAALGAVMGKLMDVLIGLGESLFKVFQDPQQALKDFGKLLKENITNRIDGILELLPALGKAISLALKGKFTEAAKTAVDAAAKVSLGVENITDKISKAAAATAALAASVAAAAKEGARIGGLLNEVEKAERQLITQRAIANKQIAEARFIADDLTKSVEERIAAVELAAKLEGEVADKELATQRKKASALKAQADISESNKETLREVAEAEARVSELEQASIARKRRLAMETKSLLAEQLAAGVEELRVITEREAKVQSLAAERIKVEKEVAELEKKNADARKLQQAQNVSAYNGMLAQMKAGIRNAEQQELAAAEQQYLALTTAAIKAGKSTVEATQLYEAKKRDIKKKYADEAQAMDLANAAASVQMAGQAFGALAQLTDALGKGNERSAARNFKITKSLRIGEAIASTAAAIMTQLAVPQDALTGANFVKAGIAAVTGAAQIATIGKTKFQPGGGGGGSSFSSPSIPTSSPSAQPMTPNINFNSTENQLQGLVNRPMRAYVINQDITNANQLERRIRSSATIGG